jgi:hypothetical protein
LSAWPCPAPLTSGLHERADHGGKRAICAQDVTATSSSYRKKTAQKEELRSV